MLTLPRGGSIIKIKINFFTIYKVDKEIITFGNIEIEKYKFHQHKSLILIHDINIDRIVVSNKVPFGKKGFKYFIGYEDDSEKLMPLCIMRQKMRAYIGFVETKYMSFLLKDNKFLEKYNEIGNKMNKVIKKGFDSEPVYSKKYLKTKIKFYEGKANKIFIMIEFVYQYLSIIGIG